VTSSNALEHLLFVNNRQQAQKPPEKQADTTDVNANPAGAKTKLSTSKKQQKLHKVEGDGAAQSGAANSGRNQGA
jgi:hypothetical protein